MLEQVLSAPAAAAHAGAAGSGKRRAELEASIVAAVSTALHWLCALKQVNCRTSYKLWSNRQVMSPYKERGAWIAVDDHLSLSEPCP